MLSSLSLTYMMHIMNQLHEAALLSLYSCFCATPGAHSGSVYTNLTAHTPLCFNPVSPPPLQDPTLEFMRKFAIGLVSGTISSCVNIPFDVAKSRIQGPQPVPGEIKYRTCFQTMALVSQEEG